MRRQIIYDPGCDYYAVLGVASDASHADLRRAYRQRVRETHPDMHPNHPEWATKQLQRVNEAFDVLRRPMDRLYYDHLRRRYLGSIGARARSPGSVRSSPSGARRSRVRTTRDPPPRSRYPFSTRGPPPSSTYTRYQSRYSSPGPNPATRPKRRYYTRSTRTYVPLTQNELRREKIGRMVRTWAIFLLLALSAYCAAEMCYFYITVTWPQITARPTRPESLFVTSQAIPGQNGEPTVDQWIAPDTNAASITTRTATAAYGPADSGLPPCLLDSDAERTLVETLPPGTARRSILVGTAHVWTFTAERDQTLIVSLALVRAAYPANELGMIVCDSGGTRLAEDTVRAPQTEIELTYQLGAGEYVIVITMRGAAQRVSYALETEWVDAFIPTAPPTTAIENR